MSHQEQGKCTRNDLNGLPRGWCWAKIENVIELCQYGSSAKTTEDGNGVPVLRMGNIRDGNLDLTDLKYLPSDHDEFPKLFLQEGDLLFNRTNSAELVGKSAVYGGFPAPCSYASYLVALRFGQSCLSKYVCLYINSRYGRSWVRSVVSQQVGQANVNSTKLRSLEIPLSPISEQRRIVAKIEELFSDLDAGVVTLGRVRANLKRYRAAVLKAAVEGKLTEDWRSQHPDTEPASILLKRLQGEQHGFFLPVSNGGTRNSGRSSRLAGPHSFDQPQLAETGLPSGWVLARLDHICKEIVDCPHSTPRWTDQGVACIRTTEFRPGRLNLDPVRYVSETTYHERIARLKPEAEDIVYSREGGILGIACIVPPGIRLCLGQRMMLMRATVSSRYLMHVLNSPRILSLVAKLTGGSASPHLNVGDVKAFPIPFPPGAEQHAIVQEVESRLSIVDEVEAQVEANLKRAARLRQGILKRAFEGRLVPQDPTDEPAEKLLERIRLQGHVNKAAGDGTRRTARQRRSASVQSDMPLFEPRTNSSGKGGVQ